MQPYLFDCDTVVSVCEPAPMEAAVHQVADWLLEQQAPESVRLAFCRILESKAEETSSRHVAVYLRNVAANCRTPLLQ